MPELTEDTMKPNTENSELLTGPVLKLIIRLATPMIVAFIFVTGYHYVDRWFVSQLGDIATAAIGMAFIVQMVIIAIGVGIGNGVNSYISRNLGASKKEVAGLTALHAFLIAIVVGIGFTVLGLLLQRPLYRLLGAEGELLELIIAYLSIIFLFTPLNLLTIISNSIFQGWGDTVSPMKFMLLGNLSNLILDPLLIFGLGPFPELGIRGAAFATAIGRFLTLGYVLVKLFVQNKPTRLKFTGFRINRKILVGIFQVGLPASLSQVLTSVAMGFIFFVLNPFGADAKAAYTIVFTYEMVVFLPAIGISQAVAILTGHNFGARLLGRVNKIFFTGVGVSFMMMLISASVIWMSPQTFAGVFARSSEVLDISTRALQITAIGYIFISLYLCGVASFQGLGLGRQYLLANVFRLYFLQVPFAYFAARWFGLEGVWWGLMLVNMISAIVLLAWHRYVFKFKVITGEVQPL